MKKGIKGETERGQIQIFGSQTCEKSDSRPRPIFAREPYRTMIQSKQYRKCILLHLARVNVIRKALGGQRVSYNEIRRQLKDYLEGPLLQSENM